MMTLFGHPSLTVPYPMTKLAAAHGMSRSPQSLPNACDSARFDLKL